MSDVTNENSEGGMHERQGTVWTAAIHIVTAVIGAGVLSLSWSIAQLGWIAGPLVLACFACVTHYTSTLLTNCYRAPDRITGTPNHCYIDAVKAYLSPKHVYLCACAQFFNLWGAMVGYTITTTISMNAVSKAHCYHDNGHDNECEGPGPILMLSFGFLQLLLSQLPSMNHMAWVSIVAAIMSGTYSSIAFGLSVTELVQTREVKGGLFGVLGNVNLAPTTRAFKSLQAIGNVAFAYTFAEILIEVQDTLKSPPAEHITMKKAISRGLSITTASYLIIGCFGYATFGGSTPGNILTGFGFYEPFWLVDIGNICIALHLSGAFQLFAQPLYANLEMRICERWPESKIVTRVYKIVVPCFKRRVPLSFSLLRLGLRSTIVIITTIVGMALPFFNSIVGMLGALSFWPLTVYFPIKMHIAQQEIQKGTTKWILLHVLIGFTLCVCVAVSIGAGAEMVDHLKEVSPFTKIE
ncbi:amino acid permease 1 [Rhynchospora pubera]|uniref:Amino acid permease 1 n=1 Tax=Rhynchospora pubera TaxID=906938 RepID=A0AAV8BZC8_9POAL|nr:amino acid permease 1 [Rhynchospora pubera]KAJ4758394.1 amino acid permease 1 [Rhynchospora pubera]KAJ4799230.1 amino acid permease 1 [Rhynchospora pubera]KAJ4810831.1 amino acid permease 1 [Rhynchospora pubera]